MKVSVFAFAGFLALAVAQAPPSPPKAPAAPKPASGDPAAPKSPGGKFAKYACAKDCLAPLSKAAESAGCVSPGPPPAFPNGGAGGAPGPKPAAPPTKANIVKRQGSKGKGGKGAPGGGKGGAPGGGKGKFQLPPEFQEYFGKAKTYMACGCKSTAPAQFFSCASKACTDPESLTAIVEGVNGLCSKSGAGDGFKPLTAPAAAGAPAAKIMSAV